MFYHFNVWSLQRLIISMSNHFHVQSFPCPIISMAHHFNDWSFQRLIISTYNHSDNQISTFDNFDIQSLQQSIISTFIHFDVWSYQCLIILMSDHFDGRSFWRSIISTYNHFGVWSFRRPIILTFDHLVVWSFRHLIISMFNHFDVRSFPRLIISTFRSFSTFNYFNNRLVALNGMTGRLDDRMSKWTLPLLTYQCHLRRNTWSTGHHEYMMQMGLSFSSWAIYSNLDVVPPWWRQGIVIFFEKFSPRHGSSGKNLRGVPGDESLTQSRVATTWLQKI